jgi:hypothetical protein
VFAHRATRSFGDTFFSAPRYGRGWRSPIPLARSRRWREDNLSSFLPPEAFWEKSGIFVLPLWARPEYDKIWKSAIQRKQKMLKRKIGKINLSACFSP